MNLANYWEPFIEFYQYILWQFINIVNLKLNICHHWLQQISCQCWWLLNIFLLPVGHSFCGEWFILQISAISHQYPLDSKLLHVSRCMPKATFWEQGITSCERVYHPNHVKVLFFSNFDLSSHCMSKIMIWLDYHCWSNWMIIVHIIITHVFQEFYFELINLLWNVSQWFLHRMPDATQCHIT